MRLLLYTGIAQLVEQRLPKPRAVGPSPSARATVCNTILRTTARQAGDDHTHLTKSICPVLCRAFPVFIYPPYSAGLFITVKEGRTMDYKDKIQWLRRYRTCKRKEAMLCCRIEAARDRATSLMQAFSPVSAQNATLTSAIEKTVENVDFLQHKLLDLAMWTDKVLDEIEDALVLLDDAECDVLQKRYIECMTFQEIADALHITPRRVYQLHRKGVEALQCTEPPLSRPAEERDAGASEM